MIGLYLKFAFFMQEPMALKQPDQMASPIIVFTGVLGSEITG